MSSPSPIPPPNDRRSSRSSSNAGLTTDTASQPEGFVVGGPPGSPSPLALRASNSPSSKRRKSRIARIPPDMHLLDYVTPPDSNLVCLICHSAFGSPVALTCDHYFCKDCLQHAWDAQPSCKTCPTCRHNVDTLTEPLPVPKIVENMLDELQVRCPNSKLGCSWVDQRVNLHNHVMLYCEYTLVECPSFECKLPVSQKDFHKGCRHYTVSCDDCHTSLMKRDLEEHQRSICEYRMTTCPDCSVQLLRLDLKTHAKDVCPKTIIPCQGAIVGCTYSAERETVVEHEKTCPMAIMSPHFREQQARLERSEARFEQLARKLSILEDGLSNIMNMLYPANGNDSSFPVTDPLDPNDVSMPTPDFRLPPASFPPVPQNAESQTQPSGAPQPPFDSQIHHLLTLHESLRDEFSRMANRLTDNEGQTSMMIFNESQRVNEKMLHITAQMNNIQVQVHWLMSAMLQRRSTSSAGTSTGRAGGSTSASGSGSSTTQGASTNTGARAGPGSLPPLRRMSDSTRQETKL